MVGLEDKEEAIWLILVLETGLFIYDKRKTILALWYKKEKTCTHARVLLDARLFHLPAD